MKEEKDKNIHAGHRQRLRNQVLNSDLAKLPEHLIMETMLTFVIPHKDVNPLAHKIIGEFGSLANVFDASIDNLKKIDGVGQVAAEFIKFCSKLPEIQQISRAKTQVVIKNTKDAIKFLKERIAISSNERFYYICMDSSGKVLAFRASGEGSINLLHINYRHLVGELLNIPTVSVVICHTHPHGQPVPSTADINFTSNLEKVLKELNIVLCDHIILSPDGTYSFYKAGLVRKDGGDTFGDVDKLKSSLCEKRTNFGEEN